MTIRTARLRGPAVTLATALLAASVGACTSDDSDDLPPAPPASQSATTAAPSVDPQHQEILDVYYGSVEAMVTAQQSADPEHPDLTRYFLEDAQAHLNIQSTIQRHGTHGAHYTGELRVISAGVAEIDMQAEPPTATIEACLDDTDYRLVYIDDGSPVPSTEPGGQYKATSVAVHGTDGTWYIATSTSHWDEPCT